MCMFCAAVPMAATFGVVMDNKQRKNQQAKGRSVGSIRPILLSTVFIILLLMIASAYFHTKFPRYF
jgi:hypothetical protein